MWEAGKVLAEHQAQDGMSNLEGSSDLLMPLRKPDVASQISGHEGCSTIFKLLMAAAQADLAHSVSIGERLPVKHQAGLSNHHLASSQRCYPRSEYRLSLQFNPAVQSESGSLR